MSGLGHMWIRASSMNRPALRGHVAHHVALAPWPVVTSLWVYPISLWNDYACLLRNANFPRPHTRTSSRPPGRAPQPRHHPRAPRTRAGYRGGGPNRTAGRRFPYTAAPDRAPCRLPHAVRALVMATAPDRSLHTLAPSLLLSGRSSPAGYAYSHSRIP